MELITVARRAKLGSRINEGFRQAKGKIQLARDYNTKICALLEKDKNQLEFHFATYLSGILSILEAYISDGLLEYLICYPGHLEEKTIRLDDLARSGSVGQVVKTLAEKTVNALTYKAFIEYHAKYAEILGLEGKISEVLLKEVAEIKATRDIYIHANGICNDIYIKKSGDLARAREGEKLDLSKNYVEMSVNKVEEYLSEVYKSIPQKIKKYGRTNAFKEMWDLSYMSSVLPFDEVWEIVDDNLVRPKERAFKWGWSSSEKAAFDFFLGIYNSEHPERKTDLMYALYRWPPETSVGKVIISWMDSPFWF